VLIGNAIQYDLEDFNIDDDKAGIHKKVHHGYQWVTEHFLLPKGQQQNILPSLWFVVVDIFIPAKIDITSYLFYFFVEKPDRNSADKNKKDLLGKLHGNKLQQQN
jgi:hypothetical protein